MKKIAVVGDIMLDSYCKGEWRKLGAEDLPIISLKSSNDYLGAAAIIAYNIKNLNQDVCLFGYIGKDDSGKIILNMLKENKINHKIFCKFKKTIKKSRINKLLRLDEEIIEPIEYDGLFDTIKKYNPDIIVVSDFGKGTITQEFFNKLKTLKATILVDPKNLDYSGAFLITPNLNEAQEMTKEEDEKKIIQKLKRKYTNILLTKGKDGMSLYEFSKKVVNIPTEAKEVYDVTGAGDAAIAVIASLLAEGKSLKESCIISNTVAGKAVEHYGQYSIKKEDVYK